MKVFAVSDCHVECAQNKRLLQGLPKFWARHRADRRWGSRRDAHPSAVGAALVQAAL